MLADNKTETGAVVTACVRIVHLAEGAENQVFHVIWDAYAGIRDRKGDIPFSAAAASWSYVHLNAAPLGELDGQI